MRLYTGYFVALLMMPIASFACDRSAAYTVQSNLQGLAQVSESQGRVTFNWGPVWDGQNDQSRLRLIRTAADADACITGAARDIRFYSNGRLVGVASPTSGIRLIR